MSSSSYFAIAAIVGLMTFTYWMAEFWDSAPSRHHLTLDAFVIATVAGCVWPVALPIAGIAAIAFKMDPD